MEPILELKDSNEVHDYIIKINKRKLTLASKNDTLDKKYDRKKYLNNC